MAPSVVTFVVDEVDDLKVKLTFNEPVYKANGQPLVAGDFNCVTSASTLSNFAVETSANTMFAFALTFSGPNTARNGGLHEGLLKRGLDLLSFSKPSFSITISQNNLIILL